METDPPPGEGRITGTPVATAATLSADESGKETFEALLQRGANFIASHVRPLLLGGVSGALLVMGTVGIANKLKETLYPSAERLVNGDKGVSARYHFVHYVRCNSQFSSSAAHSFCISLTGYIHAEQSQENDRGAEGGG